MSTLYKKNNGGYIALISAIIISFILISLTFTVSASGYFSRANVSNLEYKRISLGLAESCANAALLKVAQNFFYVPPVSGEVVAVGSESCIIKTASSTAPDATGRKLVYITTQAQYRGAWSNVKVTASAQDPSFTTLSHGTLVVYTHVINNNGGTSVASNFSITIGAAANPSPSTFAGQESGISVLVDAGSAITVGVTSPSGYGQTLSGCSGVITAGATQSCVITEDDIPNTATLTLIANVKNDNGGTLAPSSIPLFLDGSVVSLGIPVTLVPGTHKATSAKSPGYATSTWGYQCPAPGDGNITLNKGDNKTCVVVYDDIPPPAPACVDTVLMLSGHMTGMGALAAEASAVKSFIDLTASDSPASLLSIGSYGGIDGSAASIPASGQLTSAYGADGISASTTRNYPSAIAAPNQWTSPTNIFTNDLSFATDSVSGHAQGYGNFNLSIPSTAIISGIEFVADGLATPPIKLGANLVPSNTYTNNDVWLTDKGSKVVVKKIAAVNDQATTTYLRTSTLSVGQTFTLDTSSIPSGASIKSVTLNVVARKTSGSPVLFMRVENGIGGQQNYPLNGTLGASWVTYQATTTNDPFNGTPWTLSELSAWGFGAYNSTGVGSVDVAEVYVTYTYTLPLNATLGLEVSSDNGTTWTTTGTSTSLGMIESAYIFGNTSALWGRTWTPVNLSNGSFVVRMMNNSPSGTVISLNYLTAKVYYSVPSTGLYGVTDTISSTINSSFGNDISAAIGVAKTELNSARHRPACNRVLVFATDGSSNTSGKTAALNSADAAKLSGIETYTIHFGNPPSARDFVASIASGTTPVAGHQPGSFDDTSNSQTQSVIDAENADGDHFFISPDPSQFSVIFKQIGTVVFAGIGPPPPAPTRATIIVTTHVINDNGGPALPGDFLMTISPSLNASPISPFAGVDLPGVTVTVDPGSYVVSESSSFSGYTETDGFGCSGAISAGDIISCTITNDDVTPPPPPPPPPPPEIGIGPWEEASSTAP